LGNWRCLNDRANVRIGYRDTGPVTDGCCRVRLGGVQGNVGDSQPVRERPRRGSALPSGLNPDGRGHPYLYRDGAALADRYHLELAHYLTVLAMAWILQCPDCLVVQQN
jgi:hypothetical protein